LVVREAHPTFADFLRDKQHMENPVIIIGSATGLGIVALDIFQSNQVIVYCFLDDNKELHGKEVHEISVMGSTDDDGYLKLIGKKCEAFIATDDTKFHKHLAEMLTERRNMMPVNAIHNRSYISGMASIGHGNLINANVIINTGAKIGNHCILHAGAIIDYQSQVGDFVQIGAGSVINSNVTLANDVFVGSGVSIVSGIKVGKGARIGAGSVVIEDVKAGTTIFGNPAKAIGK
jgi:sugar O-acyltransferase (sialic acid O-acetyltransferase NeuD family)